jgi:hypothetical protein
MKVKILRFPRMLDWMRCKDLALVTVGKQASLLPSEEWKKQMLTCEHSPIRTLMFTIEMRVPYWVSVHFARHKYGVEHYVRSQRPDITGESRDEKRQDETVVHVMDINAQELIFMARRRLCNLASKETRHVMNKIVKAVTEACPEFKGFLVKNCEYMGRCPEMRSCGKVKR